MILEWTVNRPNLARSLGTRDLGTRDMGTTDSKTVNTFCVPTFCGRICAKSLKLLGNWWKTENLLLKNGWKIFGNGLENVGIKKVCTNGWKMLKNLWKCLGKVGVRQNLWEKVLGQTNRLLPVPPRKMAPKNV